MAAMKWTLEEFDRQPFPLMMELMGYFAEHPPEHICLAASIGWKPKNRKKVKCGYENEAEFQAVGLLPSPKNTAPDETFLPDWARDARQMIRAEKMRVQIERKSANG
jgi:hypothetical protein